MLTGTSPISLVSSRLTSLTSAARDANSSVAVTAATCRACSTPIPKPAVDDATVARIQRRSSVRCGRRPIVAFLRAAAGCRSVVKGRAKHNETQDLYQTQAWEARLHE